MGLSAEFLDLMGKLVVGDRPYGVHIACHEAIEPSPMFLCMKSICDFAADKNDDWQDYAAFTAAQLCHWFLVEEWEMLFPEDVVRFSERG